MRDGDVTFDAADSRLASREELASQDPEQWQDLPLSLAPATSLIELDWPVHKLQSASEPQLPDGGLEPNPVALCVFRRDEQAHWRELDALEHRMLGEIGRGISFGTLCETIAAVLGDDRAPTQAATWLARLSPSPPIRAI